MKDTLAGLKVGLIMATFFSAWATLLRFVLGPGAFSRFGLSWTEIVIFYYGALAIGGATYGALRPLRGSAIGSMGRGIALMLPGYLVFTCAIGISLGKLPSTKVGLLLAIILGGVGGSILGLWNWIEAREKEQTQADTFDRVRDR